MSDFLERSDEILSVSEFSRRFKTLVKTAVPEFWIRGEVSGTRAYSSGHTYFTLKDEGATLSAVLFKGYSRGMSVKISDGARVLLYGEVGVYEARGTYQFIVKAALDDGAGELARRFEALKKKLEAEGLFDPLRKRSIPRFPKRIAVVTSPSGAAVRDFVSILRRRMWFGEVLIFPCRVQGAEAAGEIVSALRSAQETEGVDLAVVMRGGGSLEDLWPFNEEIVARAVAGCRVPVISAVGHEIDFSLSDFAADLRAETPSAAAELVSSGFLSLVGCLREAGEEIFSICETSIADYAQRLENIARLLRLNSPSGKIENYCIRLDELHSRLYSRAEAALSKNRERLAALSARFGALRPSERISEMGERLNLIERNLNSLSFESALGRGFAAVLGEGGKFKSSARDFFHGENIKIKFSDGDVDASVR